MTTSTKTNTLRTNAPNDRRAADACLWISQRPETIPSHALVWRQASGFFQAAGNWADGQDYDRSHRDRQQAHSLLTGSGLRLEMATVNYRTMGHQPPPDETPTQPMPAVTAQQAAPKAPPAPQQVAPPEPARRAEDIIYRGPAEQHREWVGECALRAMNLRTMAGRTGPSEGVRFGLLTGAAACLDRAAIGFANAQSTAAHSYIKAAEEVLASGLIACPWPRR